MRKAFMLFVLSCLFTGAPLLRAAQPTAIFTDLLSGPNSGGQNNQGAIVTVYGFGFGATRGSSAVTIGGAAPAAYLFWSDSKISFQLGNSAVTGSIVVNVAGAGASNAMPFTVRSGRIFFVAPGGTDTNAGSFTSPWATVRHAKNSAQPGDIIYLMNGVNETSLDGSSSTLAIAKSGSSGLPIALVAYPGATATIGSATGQPYGIRTTSASSNWVLAGLSLRGAFSALAVANSSNWRVIGNDVSCPNGSGSGACAEFSTDTNVSLYRNRIHDSGSTTSTNIKLYQGVQFDEGSNGIDFGWNEIAGIRSCRALQFFSDTTPLFNITVRNNLIHDSRCDGINFQTVSPSQGAVKAYNNVIYRAGTGPAPGGVEANYACINAGGNGSAAIQITGNTLYDCGRRANADSGAVAASAPVSLTDNIVDAVSGETYLAPNSSPANFSATHNLFFGDGAPPSFSSSSVSADPKFVDAVNSNFQLQTGSPAIDAGANDGISRDILQTPRPQGAAYDIGAYEFKGGTTQPPPPPPTQGTLTVSPQSVVFGNVVIGSSAKQTVTLSNGSTASLTISSVGISGTGFSQMGPVLPLTLAPGQSSTVAVTFTPQNSGSVTGALQINSNASDPSVTVVLSGTGSTVQHTVDVNWSASTSTVAGYNVYRGTVSGGPYSKINSALVTGLTFTDNTVSSGATYFYVVTAVAADGTESAFSSQVQAVIPTP
ncbi:MAG TPA: choice-of-anchor D domain-containing protein [Candidatus Angelobacter sp.]|nr:choice-of-anchor D domain-containing protein [Candidatus Angelobacter sp.]